MNNEKDQVEAILQDMPNFQIDILRDILEEEKYLSNRDNLQGSNIVNKIVNIVKERVNLD